MAISRVKNDLVVTVFLFLYTSAVVQSQTVNTINAWSSLQVNKSDLINPCNAFFLEYMKAVNNFTHCELQKAKPFRLCSKCIEHYTIATAIYQDILIETNLADCRERYFESDSIQIIPTVQSNMDSIWKSAACIGYAEKITYDKATATVTIDKLYDDVEAFLDLYENLTVCLNKTEVINFVETSFGQLPLNICSLCHSMYDALNKQFNSMKPHNQNTNDKDDTNNNNICMDIVDMMNHTRILWTRTLLCSPRSGNLTPVVSITCVVGVTPIFFYLLSKITGREGFRKIYRQKRLALSRTRTVSAPNTETSAIQRLSQRLPSFTR